MLISNVFGENIQNVLVNKLLHVAQVAQSAVHRIGNTIYSSKFWHQHPKTDAVACSLILLCILWISKANYELSIFNLSEILLLVFWVQRFQQNMVERFSRKPCFSEILTPRIQKSQIVYEHFCRNSI